MKPILPPNFNDQVAIFWDCLQKFNKIHSLTNYENLQNVLDDSLGGLEFIEKLPKVAIDIGSGAGFPAIFLAIALPYTKWHLFEPNAKKSAFLTYAKVNLKLANVKIYKDKIECVSPFVADLIISRAVMKTKNLIEISKGFYDKNTQFLFYKGTSVEGEILGLKAEIFEKNNRKYLSIKGENVG